MQCGLESAVWNPTGCLDEFLNLHSGDKNFAERGARLEKPAFNQSSHGFCAAVEDGGGLLDVQK